MAEYPHLFLGDIGRTINFRTPQSARGSKIIPARDRAVHAAYLRKSLDEIWSQIDEKRTSRNAISLSVKKGYYFEVKGAVGSDLIYKSLENRTQGLRLLNVKQEGTDSTKQTQATIFVPEKKRGYFLKIINQYAEETSAKGKPRNKDLIESIEGISEAVLQSFWQDSDSLIPDSTYRWYEVWLSTDDDSKIEEFYGLCLDLNIQYQEDKIIFPERTVCLIHATADLLNELIQTCAYLAEMRLAKDTTHFWTELENKEQSEWVEDLGKRLDIDNASNVTICILDKGINNGHKLIAPFLEDSNLHSVDNTWGSHDDNGHGTLMAGITIYDNLENALKSSSQISIYHQLESVKILPPKGTNSKKLYGAIVQQAVSRVEITDPDKKRIFCMAVTDNDNRDKGKPSSWSGALDKIISGCDDGDRRLIIVSGGNANTEQNNSFRFTYPTSNLSDSVHDPGQSWNAITVGAYTEKTNITEETLSDYKAIAKMGSLSPHSTTSLAWLRKWPVKPDILFEGGNLAEGPDGFITVCDDLSELSTNYQPHIRQFGVINATSCATAKAAWFAAQIQRIYPDAWPETIRGLIIHSADWPDTMKKDFLNSDNKTDYSKLLRICGYGVPSLTKAIECSKNSLTLIVQDELQPFTKEKSAYTTKDMHLFELPWPKSELLNLVNTKVILRATLSYFIEPGPGEIGWKDKYRYASHGLRFELNSSTETVHQFEKRLNKLSRDIEDKGKKFPASSNWILGSNNRKTGSIHSDIWHGTAAELASCNVIGIYPVIGWWRERPHLLRWNKKARYSLIVSIYSPNVEIDIYTPVVTKIKTPVEVEIKEK